MSSTGNTSANAALLAKFLSLKQPNNKICVTYCWNDGRIEATRSKSRVFNFVPERPEDLPNWNFGFVVKSEEGKERATDHFLKPVALYNDPFRGGDNKLVWCETVTHDGEPTVANTRASCLRVMNKVMDKHEPWFGIEQEYCLMEPTLGSDARATRRPLGWPVDGSAPPFQGYDYLYGVGSDTVIGREIHEAALRACLYAGVEICGENSEGMPCQWEYQVGPLPGIACADDLWITRHILRRVAEEFRVSVSLDPRIKPGWPGTGAHTNFSTKQTRDKASGMKAIEEAIAKLSLTQARHIKAYDPKQGKDNERRLIGGFVNCRIDTFTYGIADRQASVRIPQNVASDGYGYLEDRRPAGNCDPYVVMEAIVRTTCLNE